MSELVLGWTAKVNGTDLGETLTLLHWDGSTDSPAYLKSVALLNDQMQRHINKELQSE